MGKPRKSVEWADIELVARDWPLICETGLERARVYCAVMDIETVSWQTVINLAEASDDVDAVEHDRWADFMWLIKQVIYGQVPVQAVYFDAVDKKIAAVAPVWDYFCEKVTAEAARKRKNG